MFYSDRRVNTFDFLISKHLCSFLFFQELIEKRPRTNNIMITSASQILSSASQSQADTQSMHSNDFSKVSSRPDSTTASHQSFRLTDIASQNSNKIYSQLSHVESASEFHNLTEPTASQQSNLVPSFSRDSRSSVAVTDQSSRSNFSNMATDSQFDIVIRNQVEKIRDSLQSPSNSRECTEDVISITSPTGGATSMSNITSPTLGLTSMSSITSPTGGATAVSNITSPTGKKPVMFYSSYENPSKTETADDMFVSPGGLPVDSNPTTSQPTGRESITSPDDAGRISISSPVDSVIPIEKPAHLSGSSGFMTNARSTKVPTGADRNNPSHTMEPPVKFTNPANGCIPEMTTEHGETSLGLFVPGRVASVEQELGSDSFVFVNDMMSSQLDGNTDNVLRSDSVAGACAQNTSTMEPTDQPSVTPNRGEQQMTLTRPKSEIDVFTHLFTDD